MIIHVYITSHVGLNVSSGNVTNTASEIKNRKRNRNSF